MEQILSNILLLLYRKKIKMTAKRMILSFLLFSLILPKIALAEEKEDYYPPYILILGQTLFTIGVTEGSFGASFNDDMFGTLVEGKLMATKQFGIYSGLFASGAGKEKVKKKWHGEYRESTRPKRTFIKPTIGAGFEIKKLRFSAGYSYEIEDKIDFKKFTPYIGIGYNILGGKEEDIKYRKEDKFAFEGSILIYSTLLGIDAPYHSGMFSAEGKISRYFQAGFIWSLPPVFDDGSFFWALSMACQLEGKPLYPGSAISFGPYIGLVAEGDTELLEDVKPAKSPLYGVYGAIKVGYFIPVRIDLLRDSLGKEQILVSFGFRMGY